jgi:hypothetical protein
MTKLKLDCLMTPRVDADIIDCQLFRISSDGKLEFAMQETLFSAHLMKFTERSF